MKYIKKYPVVLLVILTVIFLFLFKKVPSFTEAVYSRFLYPIIATLLSNISKLFFFSLFDLLIIGLIVFFFYLLVYILIIKRNSKRFGKNLLKTLATLFIAFYWFWGFNYYREDPYTRYNIEKTEYNTKYVCEALDSIIPSLNQNYSDSIRLSLSEMNSIIEDTYEKYAKQFKLNYPNGKRRPKHMILSGFSTKGGVHGYFGPAFNEIHLNQNLLPIQIPTVLAHEKAHQFGITSEAEANFYGYYICKHSNNKQIEYCADLFMTRKLLRNLDKESEEYQKYIKLIRKEVLQDYRNIKSHWKKLLNVKVSDTQAKVYHTYLKSQGIKSGIKNYDEVTSLLISWNNNKNQ